jgi:cell division protein FtsB
MPATRPRVAEKVPLLFSFLRKHGGMVLGLTLLVVLVHDVFGTRGLLAMRRSQQEVERLRAEISRIHEENQRAAEHVKALKTDPKLIERIAREQMGLARPGERIYRLSPQEETPASASQR